MRAREFTKSANAQTILKYVKSIHDDFHLDDEILKHPQWQLKQVPLSSLHVPDPESGVDPEDPYDRVQYIDMYHVDDIKAGDIERKPIVVDSNGHILDGNHRAVAARLMGLKTIPAWVPVEQINEYRDRMFQYLRKQVPNWPEYIVKDWLYANFARGDVQGPTYSFATIGQDLPKILSDTGVSKDTRWKLIPNMKFTMNMWEPVTLKRLKARAGGNGSSSDSDVHIPARDAERHATQAALAKQQGGVRKEPVIVVKRSNGYELLEGWHRTIQHFALYPNGYTGPAWVAVAQNISEQRPQIKFLRPGELRGSFTDADMHGMGFRRAQNGAWYISQARWDALVATGKLSENFADGDKPGRKGLAKRMGVNCKQSVSKLRTIAKNSSGEKQRMAHWCANMKAGKK